MMDGTPLHDKVWVRLLTPDEQKSRGGLIVPETNEKDVPLFGEVLKVGPGRHAPDTGVKIPMQTKEGWIVMFSRWAGQKVSLADESYVILRDEEPLMSMHGFQARAPRAVVDQKPTSE